MQTRTWIRIPNPMATLCYAECTDSDLDPYSLFLCRTGILSPSPYPYPSPAVQLIVTIEFSNKKTRQILLPLRPHCLPRRAFLHGNSFNKKAFKSKANLPLANR